MKPLAIALGCVCLATCGVVLALAVVVFMDEWITPWDRRGKG
jgi:hypothetical protein